MVLNTRDNGFMYYEKDRKKAGRCRRQTPRKAARRMASERLGRLIPPPDTSITARKRLSPPPLASLPLLPATTSRKHDRPPECVTGY